MRSMVEGARRHQSALSPSRKCETIGAHGWARSPRPVAFAVRRRRGGRRSCADPPRASARTAQGPNDCRRRGQGGGGDGGGGRKALARAARGAGRHPRRPWRADEADSRRRGRTSEPGRGRHGGRGRNPGDDARPHERRSRARAHLRRRVGAAVAAGWPGHARRQAGDHPRAPQERRAHRRNEHRAQASLGDQGRKARDRCGAGAGRDPHPFRRARRRPVGDRIRPDGCRRQHSRRCARGAGALPDRCPAARRRPSRRSLERDAEARRPAALEGREPPRSRRRAARSSPPRPKRARPAMFPSFSATRSKARRANARSFTPASRSAPRETASRFARLAFSSPAARRR